MNKISTLLIIGLFPCLLFGQSKSDSLRTLFDQSDDWNHKALLAYQFSKVNLMSDQEACLKIFEEVEKNQDKVLDSIQLFNMHNMRGIIFLYRHEIDTSNYFFDRAADIALQMKDSAAWTKSQLNVAINMKSIGQYQEAIAINLKVIKYFRQTNENIALGSALSEIGNAFIYLKNYSSGKKYQLEAIAIFEKEEYWRGIGNANNSLAFLYNDQDMMDSVLYYSRLSLEAHQKSQNIYGMANAKGLICTILKKSDAPFQEIYDCYLEVLTYNLKIKNKEGIILTNINLSILLNEQQKYMEAVEMVTNVSDLVHEFDNKRLLLEVLTSLAISHRGLGHHDKAYMYLDSAKQVSKDLSSLDIQEAAIEAEKKYQVVEKNSELLQSKKEKSELDYKIAVRNNQLIGIAGVSIALLMLVAFLYYRKRQKLIAKIAQVRIEEQKKGLAAVIQTQEEERKRIAKDLHDGIVQQLGALKLGLERVFVDYKLDESDRLMTILHNSTTELRELSHQMMPRALGELGLIAALEDLLNNSLGQAAIHFDFEHFGMETRLEERIEIALYRITQELINNVIKHSQANSVHIQLFTTGGDTVLIVEDNGKGMNELREEKGIGLMNIASRLDTLNGKVDFSPSPNSGTLATIKIPHTP